MGSLSRLRLRLGLGLELGLGLGKGFMGSLSRLRFQMLLRFLNYCFGPFCFFFFLLELLSLMWPKCLACLPTICIMYANMYS